MSQIRTLVFRGENLTGERESQESNSFIHCTSSHSHGGEKPAMVGLGSKTVTFIHSVPKRGKQGKLF